MPVVVPAVSDGVAPEEVGWKRKLRGSGWTDARGALARKESLGGRGQCESENPGRQEKKRILGYWPMSIGR